MYRPGIYKIQSLQFPDRVYVGSATNIKSRWCLHLKDLLKNKHHSGKLQNHYNKYGKDDLVFTILELCMPAFLLDREQYYLNSLDPYFNICKVANSRLGVKVTEVTRKKMSKGMQGRIPWNKGLKTGKRSPEFCKQRSEYMKGRSYGLGRPSYIRTPEIRDKMRGPNNPNYGKKIPYKPRKKREIKVLVYLDAEKKEKKEKGINIITKKPRQYTKIANPKKRGRKKGYVHDAETKLKISIKRSMYVAPVETRIKMSNSKLHNQYARKKTINII